jgi:hypothetical protein
LQEIELRALKSTLALFCKSKLVSTLSRIPVVLLVSFCRELTWRTKSQLCLLKQQDKEKLNVFSGQLSPESKGNSN